MDECGLDTITCFRFPSLCEGKRMFDWNFTPKQKTGTPTRRYRNSKTDKQIKRTLNAFFMFFSFLFFLFLFCRLLFFLFPFFQYLSVFMHSSIMANRKSSTVENPRKSLIFSLTFHLNGHTIKDFDCGLNS